MAVQIADNCAAQADNWILQLEPCINGNATIRTQLRTKLIDLCKLGGDLNHPNGSNTTAPGKMNADGDTSFRQVIKRVLGISQFTMTCNPWLLDAPYEYRKPALSATVSVSSTNTAICDILTRERNAMPQGITFYNYLKGKYKEAMTLTEAELTMLENGCGNCRYLLAKEIQLPSFLQQNGDGCVTPAMFQQGVTALQQEMNGNLTTTHANYETVFATYLNHRWGFTLSYADYAAFNDTITKNPSASLMLCNRPAFSAVKQDPYSCMLEVVDDAAASGHVLYNEYIEEVRKNFRKDYIAYCTTNKPEVDLTVPQQKYHYTLYYYDQAGNLTRTVPPEGVHLLDTSWLPQVALARDEANATCSFNGPANNTSKDTAYKYITAALNPPGKSTMEMWINNTDPNKTSSQVLATTVNRKYLLNICLSGRYANIDVYSLVPTADGTGVVIDTSWHTTGDMQSVLPLKQWTHVAILKNGVNRDNMAVYVNGVLLPLSSAIVSGGCGWEISVSSGSPVYPENLSYLKQLRIYNRLLTGAEIAANAGELCMSLSPAYATGLQSSLQHWGRFNTPVPDGNGSTAETTVVPVYPEHGLATSYAYQSLNGITVQNTPDAGKSRFWYDRLGRMVTSQNAEQLSPYYVGFTSNRYSYTKYDEQGRIIEVGEKTGAASPSAVPFLSSADVNSFLAAGTNAQITRTYYDAPFTGTTSKIPLVQENLRKQVSAVIYREAATDTLQQATYYSYDQLGNVKSLWQQMLSLDIKQVDYQYDLVSGKVNKVRYQPGQTDKFFYGYQYDAENRLLKATSGINAVSSDGWDIENPQTDAGYQYYLHGPLARTELGNTQLVQGLDYAYTLQGWLKGVNGNYLLADNDIGKDGLAGSSRAAIARDAYGYSLDYYKGDYKPIGTGTSAFSLSWAPGQNTEAGRDLYNGNISRSTLAVKRLKEDTPVGYTYRYDQLNRLKGMRQHPLTVGATGWNASTASDAYKEDVTYDGNGNILTYLRNGSGINGKQLAMDQLTYGYKRDAAGNLLNNKLLQVRDNVTSTEYVSDLRNQGDTNYIYDKIGNLVKDKQANITRIQWTVYGKIKLIQFSNGSSIEYRYDPSGNRVYKQHSHDGINDQTWYVRDAQGNVLTVYGNKSGGSQLYWKEQHLYGCSRLGIWNADLLSTSSAATISSRWLQKGNKQFELSNHLGNVLAVISDKAKDSVIGGVVDHYEPEIFLAQDYYPFGMLQPDRQWGLVIATRGFNGKENDNEVKGTGNQQDYGMRVYDPRLGKFLSIDPLTKEYPELTPYQFASNTPIQAIDLDGAEAWMQQMGFALKQKAEMKIARDGQIARERARSLAIARERALYRENDIMLEINGVAQMGPKSTVLQNAAIAQEQYKDALAASITSGPWGSAGYLIGGDESAFKWSTVDGVMTSFGGIPAENARAFPQRINIAPTPFVPSVQGRGPGRLAIQWNGIYSSSEIRAAEYISSLGNNVILRAPQGTRAGGNTSDLLVNGVNYDVYTPESTNPNRIVSQISKKNTQTVGIVLDLSETTVTQDQLGNILRRVQGAGATNIKDIVIMPKKN
ncbi:MAG TPA: RHS repeat-associated core domain-containing protein, partial [Chitinophaga sp.]|nr:RHS repeat-associated core domain-containing protein [Chitinophaga sp.]